MFHKKFSLRVFSFVLMGFVAGIFLAFVLPPSVIAIVECILLGIMCWCWCRT